VYRGRVKAITFAQHPLCFQYYGLADPYAVRFEQVRRRCRLRRIVSGQQTDDTIGIDRDHGGASLQM